MQAELTLKRRKRIAAQSVHKPPARGALTSREVGPTLVEHRVEIRLQAAPAPALASASGNWISGAGLRRDAGSG